MNDVIFLCDVTMALFDHFPGSFPELKFTEFPSSCKGWPEKMLHTQKSTERRSSAKLPDVNCPKPEARLVAIKIDNGG